MSDNQSNRSPFIGRPAASRETARHPTVVPELTAIEGDDYNAVIEQIEARGANLTVQEARVLYDQFTRGLYEANAKGHMITMKKWVRDTQMAETMDEGFQIMCNHFGIGTET